LRPSPSGPAAPTPLALPAAQRIPPRPPRRRDSDPGPRARLSERGILLPLALLLMMRRFPPRATRRAWAGTVARHSGELDDLAPVGDLRLEAQRLDLRLDRDRGLGIAVDEEHGPR